MNKEETVATLCIFGTICAFIFVLAISSPTANAAETIPNVKITIHYVDNITQIPRNKGKYLYDMDLGAAHVVKEDEECEIWVLKPRNRYDRQRMDVLGHEILHCTDFDFH